MVLLMYSSIIGVCSLGLALLLRKRSQSKAKRMRNELIREELIHMEKYKNKSSKEIDEIVEANEKEEED